MQKNISPDYNRETQKAIYFYTPPFYAFDNFSAFTVEIWGHTFQTAEHAYQWKKFEETAPLAAALILKATSPHEVKKISDLNAQYVSADFINTKLEIMEEILLAKTDQHEKVRKVLQESASKEIIENSPTDYFWGIGEDGTGENQLGKLWQKIRSRQTK